MGMNRRPDHTSPVSALFDQTLWNLMDSLRSTSLKGLQEGLDAIGLMLWLRFQPELCESHPFPVWTMVTEAKSRGYRLALGEALANSLQAHPNLDPAFTILKPAIEQAMSENDLALIAGAVSRLPQAAPTIVGGAYRKALLRPAINESGMHSSPQVLSDFVCALGNPRPGEWVHDPFAGTCTFLVDAIAHLGEAATVNAPLRNLNLTGTEIDQHAWALGVLVLALHGIPADVNNGDAFVLAGDQATPDLILSEPPWGMRMKASGPGRPLFAYLPPDIPDSVAGDIATVYLVLELIRPKKGRAVMNVAPRLLFGGGAVARARRQWLDEDLIEAVITLPKGLSAASPGLPACLVVFNLRKEAARKGRILLVDGDNLGIRPSQRLSTELFEQDSTEVIGLFQRFDASPGRSVIVTVNDLEAHEGDLSPNRYMSTEYEPERLSAIEELFGRTMLLEEELEAANKDFIRAAENLFAKLKP